MATARSWRHARELEGPQRARLDDVRELNQVFSDAFTDRYRRDGMVGVRVPYLNPAVWRYAIEDADGGARLGRRGVDGPTGRARRVAGAGDGHRHREGGDRLAQGARGDGHRARDDAA